ncbi:hypothetical protein Tco_1085715 [Tanacetum coccineum]
MRSLEHLDVRLRGYEKRKERKECLKEGEDEKRREKECVCLRFKIEANRGEESESVRVLNKMVARKKVISGYVVENVLMGCEGAYVGHEGEKRVDAATKD